ncbi:MAG TPA: hypothetical protein VH598_02425, partial [Verrucomicrobiae bacterium]|nr:hypothetical protein [Verrucomicrobiae bacterium]
PDCHRISITAATTFSVWDLQSATKIYTTNSSAGFRTVGITPDGTRAVYVSNGIPAGNRLYAVDLIARTNWVIVPVGLNDDVPFRFSGDGRFLVYATTFAEVPSDRNGLSDIYLYDFQTRSNLLVSQSFDTSGAGDAKSDSPEISSDGRFIVYRSYADNIVPGDTNGVPDLFMYDRLSGATTLVSASRFGNASGDNRSISGFFSGDAQTLVIHSWASDLVPADFNQTGDLLALKLYSPGMQPPFSGALVFSAASGHQFFINWPAMPGRTYRVQFKNSLGDPVWQDLNGLVTIAGNTGQMSDAPPNGGQRFYRILSVQTTGN